VGVKGVDGIREIEKLQRQQYASCEQCGAKKLFDRA